MNNTNNISARASFEIAKALLVRAFRSNFKNDANPEAAARQFVDQMKLTQGEIRLEVELNTTSSIYTFGVNPNQANSTNVVFPTERRLNMQDTLVMNEYGFYVATPASRTATEFPLMTYGNTQNFAAAADALAIDNGLYGQGYFQIKCNNDVLVPYRSMMNHFYRGQTQQTAALGAGSPGDQLRGVEDGFTTVEPNILLIGSKNNVPQIELPAALSNVTAFSRIVFFARGILAQNSTVVS